MGEGRREAGMRGRRAAGDHLCNGGARPLTPGLSCSLFFIVVLVVVIVSCLQTQMQALMHAHAALISLSL